MVLISFVNGEEPGTVRSSSAFLKMVIPETGGHIRFKQLVKKTPIGNFKSLGFVENYSYC